MIELLEYRWALGDYGLCAVYVLTTLALLGLGAVTVILPAACILWEWLTPVRQILKFADLNPSAVFELGARQPPR